MVYIEVYMQIIRDSSRRENKDIVYIMQRFRKFIIHKIYLSE
jgi:hypothetical protein